MQSSLYDLEAAEAHWIELRAEAEQERQAKAILKQHPERKLSALLARSILALRGRRAPRDPRSN
jgi:hypothetical protein